VSDEEPHWHDWICPHSGKGPLKTGESLGAIGFAALEIVEEEGKLRVLPVVDGIRITQGIFWFGL
jgi:hypothetical protein